VGTWHDPDLGRPIAAQLEWCTELLGVDLATLRELAAKVEPYIRADGTREPDGYQRLSDLRVPRPAHDLRILHMQQWRNQPEPDTRPAL
jgi:hypothetical protein